MKKSRKKIGIKHSTLVSAVLIGLMSITPYVSAEDTDYLATEYIEYDGRNVAELNFLAKDQGIGKKNRWLINPSRYDMSDDLIDATVDSTTYWTDMLGDGLKNDEPWQIFIHTDYQRNASASSPNIKSNGVRPAYNSYYNGESFVRHQLQYGDKLEELTIDKAETGVLPVGNYGYSNITVGYAFGAFRQGAIDGWWVDNDTVLPTNEFAADYVGTIRHELGHALGIHAAKRTRRGNTWFHPGLNDETSWTLQLQDQNGNKAKAGMQIITSATFEKWKANDPSLSVDDYFIVDDEVTADGKGYAYFSGKNVVDALGGATFFGRSAVPVNGWERRGFEGSHIQTAGMMSHRDYSNYTSFLEVELAVMQDLGYKIDRKAYFGRSIYGNGGTINNTQGYFDRNDAGTAYVNDTFSKTPLGIGLHIYGYGNTVTQNADILTKGTGATGVRVDGMTNTLIIPKETEIHADGNRGNGVLIAYGRNQTVEQAGTVTANGNDGVGMRFDFGSSTNGASDEYRGSYIRYNRWVNSYNTGADAGTISSAENYKLTDMKVDGYSAGKDELEGPLVDDYNLSGKLVGSDAAIYIGKSAFVKNINI
ncbi:MAG: autotransporter outer membrane beta-barrel domain-containing protein, partial [Anaerovibrio sp.]|nr:autotransporter outer membrane beta-barrel domain-containing protein [Anaerovibrio sp.]